MADIIYKPYPFLFRSRGLIARFALDRPPDASYFLNLNNALERVEGAISTRYGSLIINRDPDATVSPVNYLFPHPPVALARLLVNSQPYRYAVLSDGSLWRRAGDTQGPYTQLLSLSGSPPAYPLSGQALSTLVASCYQSSQPYLFLYDRLSMLKDKGTGAPTRIGIHPPARPVTSQAYAPRIETIQVFDTAAGYTTSGGLSVAGTETAFTASATDDGAQLNGDYHRYQATDTGYKSAPDGMLATSSLADGAYRLKFQTDLARGRFDILALNDAYRPVSDTFTFPSLRVSVPASSIANLSKSMASGSPPAGRDWSLYDAADLFVIAMRVDAPQNVQEIRVQFDVASSNFTSSYYTKSLIPVSYQGYLSNPNLLNALVAVNNQQFQQSVVANRPAGAGLGTKLRTLDTGSPELASEIAAQADTGGGGGDISTVGISPSQLSTGAGAWSVIYLQKGDFLPVGSAGQPGVDWSNITGWRLQISTTDGGATDVVVNALYLQGGGVTASPVVPASGPSSYGGVGYDFRYTYYSQDTGTPSNPSREQRFPIISTNPGGVSSLLVLRQAIHLAGDYSTDPQVTHVRVWVRGGLYGQNWYYADQFANNSSGGQFSYKYSLPDSVLAGGDVLNLENDVPVTSTLQVQILTTLASAISPSPANTNTPTLVTVTTSDTSQVFVAHQVVFIGNPQNLEETVVVVGGTGTFTCYIQLAHSYLEPVQSFSRPAVACYLAAQAYGQTWLAGDPYNPGELYYLPKGFPENCPPQNHIPVGTPSDPIVLVTATRGVLFVSTLSTWYQIFPGSPPYAQPTGSKHGAVASFGWAVEENQIGYQASDGIRAFRGTDGAYRSLLIEWLYRDNPLTPVERVDLTKLSQVLAAYQNTATTFVYPGKDGNPHALAFDHQFQRWRNFDIPMTAIRLEEDTNTLVYAKPLGSGWVVSKDALQDYDDGGWGVGGQLVRTPVSFTVQTFYDDQKAPNNPKQYNQLAVDADPANQTLSLRLLFDDNDGKITPVVPTPATFTGARRDKHQFQIGAEGEGVQAYRCSLEITGAVTSAPEIYQADIHAAILPEYRAGYDSYWQKFSIDEFKAIKQGYFDYTTKSSAALTVSLYADGDLAAPYYTFTLSANLTRLASPVRVRFGNHLGKGARMMRTFRMIITSADPGQGFQLWSPVSVDLKAAGVKGYQRTPLGDITP